MADGRSEKSRAQRRREARDDNDSSPVRRWGTRLLVVAALALIAVAMADALGAFKSVNYTAVPHGSHSHYVPDDCENARTSDFPTRPPREGERITCDGQFVSSE